MARPKMKYEEQEVDEIIELKLAQLCGQKSKLTYNNVWNFNKEITNNKKYTRKNGEKYKLYGYSFWATGYNGEDYYGKHRIDEIKGEDEFILAGKAFIAEMQDISLLVNRYHKNPQVLSEKLIKLFESDRKKIKMLVEQNQSLCLALKNANNNLEGFKKSFATVFYNSAETKNSLRDVISLTKSEDKVIYDELKNMFIDDNKLINKSEEGSIGLNIIDFKEKTSIVEKKIRKLEEEGF
jgi:hypothetical protein